MKFSKKLKLAFGMLRNAKLRSWLTVIGIVIAVSSVTMILSFGAGIKTEVNNKVGSSGAKVLELYGGWSEDGNNLITLNDYNELAKLSEVESMLRSNSVYPKIIFNDIEINKQIKGFDLENFDDFKDSYNLIDGYWLEKDDVGKILISKDFLNQTFEEDYKPEIGDYFEIYGEQYQISGIFETKGLFNFGGADIIGSFDDVLDIKKAQKSQSSQDGNNDFESDLDLPPGITEDDVYDNIKIKLKPSVDFETAKKNIEERLFEFRNSDREKQNFWLQSKDSILKELNTVINVVTWVLVGFASISILVGSVGIANTMFTSVLEKTKEIGIMKSIGAKNSDIRHIFLLNSGLLGLAGGIIGVVIGMFFAFIGGFAVIHFAKIEGINFISLISFKVIFGALVFSILIGMASGFFPAKNASKMTPVDALRFE